MITLQSGETDKIIVTDTTPTPPTPIDPELAGIIAYAIYQDHKN